jgi:hypothetical protein
MSPLPYGAATISYLITTLQLNTTVTQVMHMACVDHSAFTAAQRVQLKGN